MYSVVVLLCLVSVCVCDICPDKQHQCPGESTCCASNSTVSPFSCCPLPAAVCCSDQVHCCPHGYICDVKDGRCVPNTVEGERIKGVRVERLGVGVECPGGVKTCPDEYTCCERPDGKYGCCPHENAVCCEDHIHCCAAGEVCASGGCEKNELTSSVLREWSVVSGDMNTIQGLPAGDIQGVHVNATAVGDVVCPDGLRCNDYSTCCSMGKAEFGCCPLPQATCCPDLEHCCPNGTVCTKDGRCKVTP